jgi:hypothetical protein
MPELPTVGNIFADLKTSAKSITLSDNDVPGSGCNSRESSSVTFSAVASSLACLVLLLTLCAGVSAFLFLPLPLPGMPTTYLRRCKKIFPKKPCLLLVVTEKTVTSAECLYIAGQFKGYAS